MLFSIISFGFFSWHALTDRFEKGIHLPHDTVYSVACGYAPDGKPGLIVVAADQAKVLYSDDDGLSWRTVAGDGLETRLAREVAFFQAEGEDPHFIVGTNYGLWAYQPNSQGMPESAVEISAGLPNDDRDVVDLDAPRPGSDGPLLLLTRKGNLYVRDSISEPWSLAHATGLIATPGLAAVAVTPHFDAQAAPGAAQTMWAGVQGVLFSSSNGGSSWQVHGQFTTAAQDLQDWQITAIAPADDVRTSARLVVGRTRFNASLEDEGELWLSANHGTTWTRQLTLDAGVASLAATPPGPTGDAYFYAAGLSYPNWAHYHGVGVLRSADQGQTWDDFGNDQDFGLERGPGNNTGEPFETRIEQNFAVSTNFQSDGMLFYGRTEGLYQSKDSGLHWTEKRLRSEQHMRSIASAVDAFGETLVFGGTYGSGSIAHRTDDADAMVLDRGAPFTFLKDLATSPNFEQDGVVAVAGFEGIALWADPRLPVASPRGGNGWLTPDLYDPAQGASFSAYCRAIALSPNYHGDAAPGSDQTIYWTAWGGYPPMRSRDNGATVERLDQIVGGGTAPFMSELTIAPTYDDQSPTTRTDVFGVAEKRLFRLLDTRWELVYQFDAKIRSIALHPDFGSAENRVVYAVLDQDPWMAHIEVRAGGADVTYVPADFGGIRVTAITLPPDFAQRPNIYMATWGNGVLKIDPTSPSPQLKPVGRAFPQWGSNAIACSPDFTTDRGLYAGTLYGFVKGADHPEIDWMPLSNSGNRDDQDHGLTTFAPQDPGNPQATRPWRWGQRISQDLHPDLVSTYRRVIGTEFDGSYFQTNGYAKRIEVQTFAGPTFGEVTVTVRDYFSGVLLASETVDLGSAKASPSPYVLGVDLAKTLAVEISVEAHLDGGESVLYDGVTLRR